jgi:dihydrofolate synthase/folylpolyglutamate synthase
VAAVEALLGRSLDPEALKAGAAAVTSPGRLEAVASSPLILLDGAHNPEGFRVLAESLAEEFRGVSWTLILATMADKNLAGMLPALRGRISAAVATTTGASRSMPVDQLGKAMQELLGVAVETADTPRAALELARAVAGSGGSVLVAGSLYLVGAVRSLVRGDQDPQRNER